MKTITKPCTDCGKDVVEEDTESDWGFSFPARCQECEERRAKDIERENVQRLEQHRQRIESTVKVPARLQDTDTDHPDFNRSLWARVSSWKPTTEKPWLGLVGDTGESKTRCAFLRCRQFARELTTSLNSSPRIVSTTGPDFCSLVMAPFGEQSAWAREKLADFADAEVLLFDELGKVRTSPMIIAELFSLIDHRHRENKVTIWTANTDPERFCAHWPGDEYPSAGCGRILETSTIIDA